MADLNVAPAKSGSDAYTPPTHARLTDGSVVELVKECGCVVHEGAHWLHMDHLIRAQNRQLLASIQAQAAGPTDPGMWACLCDAYMQEELARLREKRWQMERQGIAELLHAERATEVRHAG
jgi:hypothetical protein